MKFVISLFFVLLNVFSSVCQEQYFILQANISSEYVALDAKVKDHTLLTSSTLNLYSFLFNGGRNIKLTNGQVDIVVDDFIEKTNISSNYLLRVAKGIDKNGQKIIEEHHGNIHGIKNFFGRTSTGGMFRMTVNKYGYISVSCEVGESDVWNIHPIRNFDIQEDGYIMFNEMNLIHPKDGYSCGNIQEERQKAPKSTILTRGSRTWYEQELGVASDSAMWAKHGSIAAVNTHNSDVTASCEPDWSHADLHDSLTTVIIEEFVSQTHADDPWTYHDVINPNTAITEFQAWNGFNNNPDTEKGVSGNVWQGNTAGIAWVGSSGDPQACSSYNQFMSRDLASASNNRNVESHERGHNMGCPHVSGAYIMNGTVNGYTNWRASSVTIIDASIPAANCFVIRALPLRFLSFDGINQGHSIKLIWEVSEEINNDFFEVEKMHNSGEFYSIGKLDNSQEVNSYSSVYSLVDPQPNDGKNIYRIKQTDLSGSYSYSSVISILHDSKILNEIIIAPNPVNDVLSIYSNPSLYEMKWVIYNLQGQNLLQSSSPKTKKSQRIDISQLKEGIYYMEITQDNDKIQKIFVKN